jgi:hypothetical protein
VGLTVLWRIKLSIVGNQTSKYSLPAAINCAMPDTITISSQLAGQTIDIGSINYDQQKPGNQVAIRKSEYYGHWNQGI